MALQAPNIDIQELARAIPGLPSIFQDHPRIANALHILVASGVNLVEWLKQPGHAALHI